tara:strand:- start:125 stop:1489 length:1365 start_codon:yes stop_codon:yes gene_type:complete
MSDKFNRGVADEKGNSIANSTYKLPQCIIENVDGDSRDISSMVGYIKIHESIFATSLVCEVGIRDESNFLEEFNITGNEILHIEIDTKSFDFEYTLSYKFYVQEYNDYARNSENTQVQAYTLVAVSEHAYIAPLKTISRKISGTNSSIIERIMKDDLNVSKFAAFGKCGTQFDGNINISNPLKAAMSVLDTAADINRTPYFLYQDLSGFVQLTPLSYINDRNESPIYKTFVSKKKLITTPNTHANYLERSTQMLKVNSNIGLAPTLQAKKGAFASENRYIDIAKKTYRKHIFDASKVLKSEHSTSKKDVTYGQSVKNKRESETGSPLNKIPQANIAYHYVNRSAYNGPKNMNELAEEQAHISRAYISNYDACSHSFTVMGDVFLNPGRTVSLHFPKATDPLIYKGYTGKSDTEVFDLMLSGQYLIFSCAHTFQDGVHETEIIAKTDSLQPETTL